VVQPVTGAASAVKTPWMPIKIEVREGESFEAALHRFQRAVDAYTRSHWEKRRLGHHEKPGALRRREAIADAIGRRRGMSYRRYVRLRESLSR